MDIEKLIEQLKGISNGLVEDEFPKCANAVRQAATALSTLRAENERLKNKLSELAHLPFDKPGIGERTKLMAENAELRAKLEQVKRELDEAREAICTQGGVSICRYGI
jgi:seryl-tRNA synthetase